jgi:DNA-binding response OmpR family regulator
LVARIKALVRRANPDMEGNKLVVGDLELDTDKKLAIRSGQIITLTAKEYSLLEYLMLNKGKVVSRQQIAGDVWDIHFDTGTNVVDVYVNFLRKKVDKDFDTKLIQTMIGMGYMIDA